jgi:hypothetical protein
MPITPGLRSCVPDQRDFERAFELCDVLLTRLLRDPLLLWR